MENEVLFENVTAHLTDFITRTARRDISKIGTEIYDKGLKCFNADKIGEFEYVTNNKIIATVQDTEDYEVIIEKENNKIIYSCDCGKEDTKCEHVIATLIYAVENKHIVTAIKTLQNYSKDELINIILQNTTKQFLSTLK